MQYKLDKSSKHPVWKKISLHLRDSILEGHLQPGEKIPTETVLAKEYGVNRHTVRRGIQDLIERGLLRSQQGSGTYVEENVLFYPINKKTRFTETVSRQNRSRGRKIIGAKCIPASPGVASGLGVLRGREVIHLRATANVDGRPVSLSDDYFVADQFESLLEHARVTSSITEALYRNGVKEYFRKRTNVSCTMPTRQEAEILKSPLSRPLLITEKIDIDTDGHILSYGKTLWVGDRVKLEFET